MISIIIPVYNQAEKIKACLRSIEEQSYKDFEVIIVDDGSSDNLKKALDKYKASLQFKYIYQDNSGANSARNRGYKDSRGDFLLFCDADIVMQKDMLEKMYNKIIISGADFVYSSHYFGLKKFGLWEFDSELLKKMPYIHSTSLIKRSSFPGFDENIKRLQDWDLFLTIVERGGRGVFIDEFLFKVEPGGTMSSWLPAAAYKFLPFLPKVKAYKKNVEIIKNKHKLN